MKYPEQALLRRQKLEQWLPWAGGVGRNGKRLLNGKAFQVNEKFLKSIVVMAAQVGDLCYN